VWKPETTQEGFHQYNLTKNDVWAAGCILFTLLENKHPFLEKNNQNSLVDNICKKPLPQVSPLWPRPIHKLISFILNRDPNSRLKSSEVVTHLGAFIWFPTISQITNEEKQILWSENQLKAKSFMEDQQNMTVNNLLFLDFLQHHSFENIVESCHWLHSNQ